MNENKIEISPKKKDSSPSYMDRNMLYHHRNLYFKDDVSFSGQFLLFIQYLAQQKIAETILPSQNELLLFPNDYLMFTGSEIAAFCGRSKADVLKRVEGWEKTIRIPGKGEIVVSSRLDRLIHYYAHNPLSVEQIYTFKPQYNDGVKDDIEHHYAQGKLPTLIDDYIYSIPNNKTRERVYGVKLNVICLGSIITESATFFAADVPLLNGKGMHPAIYFILNQKKSWADSKGHTSFSLTAYELINDANCRVINYSQAKNLSRSKARLNKILDKLFSESEGLKLSYTCDNQNNYTFKILSNTTQAPRGYKLRYLTVNLLRRVYFDFIGRFEIPSTDHFTDEQHKALFQRMIATYDFTKRDPEYNYMFVETVQQFLKRYDQPTIRKAIDDQGQITMPKYYDAIQGKNKKIK